MEATQQRIRSLRDVDQCAQLQLTSSSTPELRIFLPDGRSAARQLSSPSDLPTTATALLVLPPPSPNHPAAASAAGPSDPLAGVRPLTAPIPESIPGFTLANANPPEAEEGLERSSHASKPHVAEFTLGAAGRVEGMPGPMSGFGVSLGGEGLVGGGWLAGVRGQYYQLWNTPHVQGILPLRQRTVVGGLVTGRRIGGGAFSVDFLLHFPELAIESSTWGNDSLIPKGDELGDEDELSLAANGESSFLTFDLRAGAGIRASIQVERSMRFFAEFGADASVQRWIPTSMPLYAKRSLPNFGTGLSLGFLWEAF